MNKNKLFTEEQNKTALNFCRNSRAAKVVIFQKFCLSPNPPYPSIWKN